MLKHRIIPILLIDGNQQVVKPVSFQRPYRKLGPLEQYVRVLERRSCDEVIIIDIEATKEGRKPRAEVIRKLTSSLFCPITYGGGISSLDDIKNCLANGADKVAINTAYQCNWNLVPDAAIKFGSQAIVVSIDYKKDKFGYSPYVRNGNSKIDYSVKDWVVNCEQIGAGEILLTDIDRDGTRSGLSSDLIRSVANAVGIPIVYCGGVRDGADALEVIKAGASAVAIGSTFLYTETTPKDISEYLDKNGVAVRV